MLLGNRFLSLTDTGIEPSGLANYEFDTAETCNSINQIYDFKILLGVIIYGLS